MPNEMNSGKIKVLKNVFMLYWKWDTMPELENPPENSPEYLLLQIYDDLKETAFTNYSFRSTIKYKEITCTEPEENDDPRYKYRAQVPDDYLKSFGFWLDKERHSSIHNSLEVAGKVIKSPYEKITIGYVSNSVDEDKLDQWVLDYLAVFIASEAADLGGCNEQTKLNLMQLEEITRIKAGKKDFDMSHHEPYSKSKFMFRAEDWC